MSLLDELAQDVHPWSLPLSLVTGQLSHNLKRHKVCYHEAIQFAQANLHDKVLTAFDTNNIDKSRRYAVKICIEVTLELLTKSLSDKIKILISWTGIGTSLQTAVLHNLWKNAKHEARNDVDVLWTYGLVQYTDITILPHNNIQHCVKVHDVISQYIIKYMDSDEVFTLLPSNQLGPRTDDNSVYSGLFEKFLKSSGVHDQSSLSGRDYLKFQLSLMENSLLLNFLKQINMVTITDPHCIIGVLQNIQDALMTSPDITAFFPTLNDEIKSVITDCHKILNDAHKLSRSLNQTVQGKSLVQTIEKFNRKYSIVIVVQQAINMVKNVFPYCDEEL